MPRKRESHTIFYPPDQLERVAQAHGMANVTMAEERMVKVLHYLEEEYQIVMWKVIAWKLKYGQSWGVMRITEYFKSECQHLDVGRPVVSRAIEEVAASAKQIARDLDRRERAR